MHINKIRPRVDGPWPAWDHSAPPHLTGYVGMLASSRWLWPPNHPQLHHNNGSAPQHSTTHHATQGTLLLLHANEKTTKVRRHQEGGPAQ